MRPKLIRNKKEEEEAKNNFAPIDLTIVTWGNRVHSQCPIPVQRNFCASGISPHGRVRGLDLHKLNGTNEEVQKRIWTAPRFQEFADQIRDIILQLPSPVTIGINCQAGHHRSVAAAEYLKKMVFPQARVIHTCLKRR